MRGRASCSLSADELAAIDAAIACPSRAGGRRSLTACSSASPVPERADVVVIGGGINGISTFRELALQGVDVVLLERDDFCSGASAALSRMVHGGLRYLENGEFQLVRQSLLRARPSAAECAALRVAAADAGSGRDALQGHAAGDRGVPRR